MFRNGSLVVFFIIQNRHQLLGNQYLLNIYIEAHFILLELVVDHPHFILRITFIILFLKTLCLLIFFIRPSTLDSILKNFGLPFIKLFNSLSNIIVVAIYIMNCFNILFNFSILINFLRIFAFVGFLFPLINLYFNPLELCPFKGNSPLYTSLLVNMLGHSGNSIALVI